MSTTAHHERSALQSKKFQAYLLAELTWKVLIAMLLLRDPNFGQQWVAFTMIITAGFLEVGFILGQTYLDRYVRTAQIAADSAKKVVDKAVDVVDGEPEKNP